MLTSASADRFFKTTLSGLLTDVYVTNFSSGLNCDQAEKLHKKERKRRINFFKTPELYDKSNLSPKLHILS